VDPKFVGGWVGKGLSSYALVLKGAESKKYFDIANHKLAKERLYEYKELLERALSSFKRAAELDPNDGTSREKIKEIQERLSKLREVL
jgi:hypothetical protein